VVTKAKKSAIITFVIVFTKHHFISINPFAFSVNKKAMIKTTKFYFSEDKNGKKTFCGFSLCRNASFLFRLLPCRKNKRLA
jgi:hypothetical protein